MNKLLIWRSEMAKKFDLPKPKKKGDVGFDLFAVKDYTLPAKMQLPIDVESGIKIKVPEGTFALMINRSGIPRKLGIEVIPGIIDEGYTGMLYSCCLNRGNEPIKIMAGTRLAQFIILHSCVPEIEEIDELPETERGETGFGSTGP